MLISKPSRQPGLRDMVKTAGCSYQAVSRVVSDDVRVSEETRGWVLAVIGAVGYRRNAVARVLVTSRSGAIGVANDGSRCYGPVGALHGVEEAARNAGHSVFLTVQGRDALKSLKATLHWLAGAFIDGTVVIVPLRAEAKTTHKVTASFSWASGLPVVILMPDPRPIPSIRVAAEDQKFEARLATRHLVRLGHQHTVHLVGSQKWLDGSVRLEGWREELLSGGLPAPEPIFGDRTGQSGHHAGVRTIKGDLPGAVFAASDLMALGMMRASNEAGV